MEDIYLIDGTGILYRCYYAIPELKTSTGIMTNAIYGFITGIFKILKEKNPKYIAVFFDLQAPTFRHITFEKYKEKRKPMPEGLSSQIPKTKEILKNLGIKYFEKEGYEADDLIGNFVRIFKNKGYRIFILTSDKDVFQFLGENVFIINPLNYEILDRRWFVEKYGFPPEKIVDFIALAGDSIDNIPGIPGIGEKTATSLIYKFGSLEEIYNNIDKIDSKKLREKLIKNRDLAFLSKELAKLDKVIFDEIEIKDIEKGKPDLRELIEIFENLEFKKLISMLKEIYPEIDEIKNTENLIGFTNGEILEYESIKENLEKYRPLLEDEKTGKIGFNLKDKILELKKLEVEFKNPVFDFSIARHLTGKAIYEENLFTLKEKYEDLLRSFNMFELFENLEMPLIEVLVWMESNGIKVNVDYLNELKERFNNEMEEIKDKIYSIAGEVFNLNSPSQVAEILFEKLKLPVIKKTKTGYSTDVSILKELSSLHPLPGLLLSYREIHKIKSTYIEGLMEFINPETGRIHPNFSQTGTSSGRLSCSNPNLQNLPIKSEKGGLIRKAFCPEEGNVFYSFDYSQIELRVLAHFSEDPVLIDAFLKDRDIHYETAEIFFPSDSLFSSSLELSKEEKRRIAKTVNFGIIYGMSAYGLSKELNISIEEADMFIKNYFERFKKVKEYIENIIERAERDGYVETLMKRRRYIPELRSSNKNEREFGKRVAINMPIQGTAAEIIKMAMVKIYKKFLKEKLKSKLILQIHDELLFEVVKEEENSVKEIVSEIMKLCVNLKVPLKVDIKRGNNYLEMEPV